MRVMAGVYLLAAATSISAQHSGGVYVHSFADTSCGAWAKSADSDWLRAQYIYWIRGFISGYNYGQLDRQISSDLMPNNETLGLYVDKYCRDNPLKPFVGAAFDLVKEVAPQSSSNSRSATDFKGNGGTSKPPMRPETHAPPAETSTPPPTFRKPRPPTPPATQPSNQYK